MRHEALAATDRQIFDRAFRISDRVDRHWAPYLVQVDREPVTRGLGKSCRIACFVVRAGKATGLV
jgi:hypothetical protein